MSPIAGEPCGDRMRLSVASGGMPEPDDEADSTTVRNEAIREGLTMALYISLSQLAVLIAVPRSLLETDGLWWQILTTSIGLVLAHQVAFRMSTRLVSDGSRLDPHTPLLQRAQWVGGGVVTLLAVLPVLLFGSLALWLSIALLLAFVMVVGYLVARSAPVSRPRALVYVGIVALVVIGVLIVKSAIGK